MAKITQTLRRRQLDQMLAKYKDMPKFRDGYIHEIRNALGMSSYQFAERLGVSQPTAISMESSEKSGAISLKNLDRAAQALGCTIAYALVPKTSLQEQIFEQARACAIADSQKVFRSMGLEQQSTTSAEQEALIEELTQEWLSKSRELWKKYE